LRKLTVPHPYLQNRSLKGWLDTVVAGGWPTG
jgi:hypothetical protein